MLAGCSAGGTDAPKEVNDAYHNKVTGNPPPPGAMKPSGPAFVGEPTGLPYGGQPAPKPPAAASGTGGG